MRHDRATEETRETAALYALGALSQHEARAFEIHLAEGCDVRRGTAQVLQGHGHPGAGVRRTPLSGLPPGHSPRAHRAGNPGPGGRRVRTNGGPRTARGRPARLRPRPPLAVHGRRRRPRARVDLHLDIGPHRSRPAAGGTLGGPGGERQDPGRAGRPGIAIDPTRPDPGNGGQTGAAERAPRRPARDPDQLRHDPLGRRPPAVPCHSLPPPGSPGRGLPALVFEPRDQGAGRRAGGGRPRARARPAPDSRRLERVLAAIVTLEPAPGSAAPQGPFCATGQFH